MSKENWVNAFNRKYDESIENGMTHSEADHLACEYADEEEERLMEQADGWRNSNDRD